MNNEEIKNIKEAYKEAKIQKTIAIKNMILAIVEDMDYEERTISEWYRTDYDTRPIEKDYPNLKRYVSESEMFAHIDMYWNKEMIINEFLRRFGDKKAPWHQDFIPF